MKFCYPVAAPDCHGSLMAFYGDFEKNLDTIRELGYQGVELLIKDTDNTYITGILNKIEECHLEVAALATSPIPAEDNIFLADDDPIIREEAMRRGMEIAKRAGKIGVPMIIGKFRGLVNPENPANGWNILRDNLRRLCMAAKPNGIIAVEIQQHGPVNTFTKTGESLELYREIAMDNFGFLLDTFHQEKIDPSVYTGFITFNSLIKFIHISDTDRLAPGFGAIRFQDVLAVLKATGYEGCLSMEVGQKPDSKTAARLCIDYLKYINDVVFADPPLPEKYRSPL
jgi:sugar phosphate isomerase/epimerase